MAKSDKAAHPPLWMTIVVFAVFVLMAGYAIFFGRSIDPFGRQLILIFGCIFFTFSLWFGAAQATAAGNTLIGKFRFVGPPAVGLVTYLVLVNYLPKPLTTNVRVYLK